MHASIYIYIYLYIILKVNVMTVQKKKRRRILNTGERGPSVYVCVYVCDVNLFV